MEKSDIPDYLKPEPQPKDYAKYDKHMEEYLKKNNFSLFDKEMANARSEKGYFYMEANFFSDLLAVAKKYIKDLPDIELVPKQNYDFDVSHTLFNGRHIIFADSLMIMFLNNFSCGVFYMTMTTSQIKDKKALNRFLVATIDVLTCRKKDNVVENHFEIITENDHSTKFACFMARAMYSFLLCHEIAHVAFRSSNQNIHDEFDADALGYEIFYSTILSADDLEYLEFFDGLRRAPLALFDIFDTVNYYKSVILDVKNENNTHPEPIIRKAALLNQFDFGDNEECFNLYLTISERATALKHYIYKYRGVMREKIKEIHLSDIT